MRKIMRSLIVCLAVFDACSAFFGFFESDEPKWNALKVKWDYNVFSNYAFDKMPTTVAEALDKGFSKLSDCDVTAAWRGARYIKDKDRVLTLLYDVNGYIAGIQAAVPKNQSNHFPIAALQPPFLDDGDQWVISVYFTDPSKICTTGRSASDVEVEGIGSNLYIQNSTSPERSILIPRLQTDLAGTQWTEGECFYTMGVHYWYNLTDDMSCEEIFPVFLLYNNGELNALGWAFTTELNTQRVEHPSKGSYKV